MSYRLADDPAEATVSVLSAPSMRAPFAAVREELGFTPQYDLDQAFDHYLA
jgi:hypothetical protein